MTGTIRLPAYCEQCGSECAPGGQCRTCVEQRCRDLAELKKAPEVVIVWKRAER